MRKKKRNGLILLIVLCLVIFAGSKFKFQSTKDYYKDDKSKGKQITVTLGIYCDTILENYSKLDKALQKETYVPKDGVILKKTTYQINEGDSAFDVLVKGTKENKIQMEYQGADENSYGSVYVQGINHLYEFSCGPLSGWIYLVNGEVPDFGCSNYKLKDGDKVEFRYTCDLGKDVGREVR